jgi:hypothetical protein
MHKESTTKVVSADLVILLFNLKFLNNMSILEKISYFDTLLSLVIVASGIKVKDDIMYDSEDNELAWEDMEYIGFENTIPYNNNHIDGLLIFGDGTIEFHEKESEEAFNWADYPIEIIQSVIDRLKEKIGM